MIDLHCHSTFSDGKLSPAALLQKAMAANVKVLALTDHDTIAGLPVLTRLACAQTIKIINGIELSTRWKFRDIHIIGLNIDINSDPLQSLIALQTQSRISRALQIAEKMKACGVSEAYDKACDIAGHKRVGRPHFAQVFINEGLVGDMPLAFKRFLGRGRPAYVPTPWTALDNAVSVIHAAKGQAVLAHPLKYSLTKTKLNELIRAFKEAGGVGLEVVSGEMTPVQIEELAGLCQQFQLLASSGSDYHGEDISRISPGRQAQLPLNCTPIWHSWTID